MLVVYLSVYAYILAYPSIPCISVCLASFTYTARIPVPIPILVAASLALALAVAVALFLKCFSV